jgi:hypothetical protein
MIPVDMAEKVPISTISIANKAIAVVPWFNGIRRGLMRNPIAP